MGRCIADHESHADPTTAYGGKWQFKNAQLAQTVGMPASVFAALSGPSNTVPEGEQDAFAYQAWLYGERTLNDGWYWWSTEHLCLNTINND